MKFWTEEKVNDFFEFIDCLNQNTRRNCPSTLWGYLRDYYVNIYAYEVIDRLNKDEMYKIIETLLNQKGEPIFNPDQIDLLIEAKEFALSSDPNKRINYICTMEINSSPFSSSDEFVKILGQFQINAISNSYLKMFEENDEYYEDYLLDITQKKLIEKYPFLEKILDKMMENGSSYGLTEYKQVNP